MRSLPRAREVLSRRVSRVTMRRATPVLVLAAAALAMLPAAWGLDNGVGRTPMMGWMAWIRFRCNIACDADPDNCISERLVKSMADAMVTGGYRDAGYEYVSIDDCWQAHERAPDGAIQPNSTRFPSGMKALGDYIHARGLKFGLVRIPLEVHLRQWRAEWSANFVHCSVYCDGCDDLSRLPSSWCPHC